MATTTGVYGVDPLEAYLAQQRQTAQAAAAAKKAEESAAGSLAGKFDTFLKILTTQLKYQDPTSATDTNQFTQELVQFAGVEQQINTNKSLQQLINLQKSSGGLGAALGYVGRYAEVPSANKVPLQNKQSEIAYSLPVAIKEVTIKVMDSTGKHVATLEGPTNSGLNRVAWDGKDKNGNQLDDGTYSFELVAKDVGGKAADIKDIRVIGMVTGIQSNADGTINMSLGSNLSVLSSQVMAVYDPDHLPPAVLGNGDT